MAEINLETTYSEENSLQTANNNEFLSNGEEEKPINLGHGEVIYIFPESSEKGIVFFCNIESDNLKDNAFRFSYSTLSSAVLNKDTDSSKTRSREWYNGVLTKTRTFIVPDVEYSQILSKIASQKNNDTVVLEVPSLNRKNEIDNLSRIKFDLIKESYDLASDFSKLFNRDSKNKLY